MIDDYLKRNTTRTLIFLGFSCLFLVAAVVLGIDDNPPGVIIASLSAILFVLAFTHHWRTAKLFLFLLLASVPGFVLFIVQDIIINSIGQTSNNPDAIKKLILNHVFDAVNLIFAMLCQAAFIVGMLGWMAMLIRNRRHTK